MLELDYVLIRPCPTDLVALVRGANENYETFQARQRDQADKVAQHNLERAKWQQGNKKFLKIMQTKMFEVIRSSIPENDADGVAHTGAGFLAIVKRQHDTHSKTYARTLINKLTSLQYSRGGVKDHILSSNNMNGKFAA
jgi:uncharacterized NAD(P)/FAD-binding protein YdhS